MHIQKQHLENKMFAYILQGLYSFSTTKSCRILLFFAIQSAVSTMGLLYESKGASATHSEEPSVALNSLVLVLVAVQLQ